ncbi:MAG: hypothetical protein ACD_51C00188G0001, partial [uncultured bacterium]
PPQLKKAVGFFGRTHVGLDKTATRIKIAVLLLIKNYNYESR